MAAGTTGGITVDVAGFKQQVDKFAKEYGVDSAFIMRDQMALWAEDLVRNTPTKSAKRKTINDAIRRQIEMIFEPVNTAAHLKWFQKKLTEGAWGPDVDIFDEVDMEAHHKRHRGANGRVKALKGSVQVGPWEMARRPHVTKRDLNAFIRKKQKRTGSARARWLSAVSRWRGRMPASWITRHANTGTGWARDRMATDGNGYLEMAGIFPYNASRISGVVRFTGNKRINDMRYHLQKRMDKLTRKHSARAV